MIYSRSAGRASGASSQANQLVRTRNSRRGVRRGAGTFRVLRLYAILRGNRVYLLYLDESGTHAGSPVFILAGVAIHEHDVYYLQRTLERQVAAALRPHALDPAEFEIHATELRASNNDLQGRPANGRGGKRKKPSNWLVVPQRDRINLLNNSIDQISSFRAKDAARPFRLFGAVVDSRYQNREERAYDLVLNKFDEMIGRVYHEHGVRERGLVLHDVRQGQDRGIQQWTSMWREQAGKTGRLHNFCDVPVFMDSRASRVIQAADLVTYSLWRSYSAAAENRYLNKLLPSFHQEANLMHGLIHVTPDYATGRCACVPCATRILGSLPS